MTAVHTNFLRRWLFAAGSWLQLGWIVIRVGVRFWLWRAQLWLHIHENTNQIQSKRSQRESSQLFMKQTLLIIRHGQTTWNVEHRLPGQVPGVALNETGKKQAERLAEALKVLSISAIISSPLERAYATAEFVAQGRELEILLEPDLMDTNIGPWAGKTISELNKQDPAWSAYVRDPTVAPEGVETFPQVQQRVVAAVERWCAREGIGDRLAFVAHADVIKLLVAHYSGLPINRASSIMIDNASVSMIELTQEHPPHVVSIGWNPQPGWLKAPEAEKKKDEEPAPSIEQKEDAEQSQEVGE
ncbi:histidine phosphatase family protein [Tengunoibacter tsumagoiensis]|uniref:Phosphoglycerate mutase n=1 Tax=Tengunoibacter tsumagoiensis TaxID=2014871 RepID=A0A401ZXR6_9CHLR|nr:histidine phosphatase family protein [Tengunoibacter tsumagoiensis]GCE11658.1 hypothetical protein KTT_15170 [Tengunoibacter tsumagoiensis]